MHSLTCIDRCEYKKNQQKNLEFLKFICKKSQNSEKKTRKTSCSIQNQVRVCCVISKHCRDKNKSYTTCKILNKHKQYKQKKD